jgi:hypothetical protein
MKQVFKALAIFILPALLSAGCRKVNQLNEDNFNSVSKQSATLLSQINLLPKEELNATELSSLMFMREEEKLARDVYRTLFVKWNATVFNNISSSEQTHMDAILILINRYGLTDPVKSDETGVFESALIKNLYIQLTELGRKSLADAYKVGATIEDLDLFDLTNALITVDNQDIRMVYGSLSKGSRNHLRSFYTNIINSGGTYTPQYITQSEFEAIINSSMETGRW